MPFSTTGSDLYSKSFKQGFDSLQTMQEAPVKARELEAATSLAESRATVARSQIDQMTRLSQADATAAKAIREANAIGDVNKTEELRMKAYGESGLFEQQEAIKKQQLERQIAGSDAIVKAGKAQETSNEQLSVSLRSVSDYGPAHTFNDSLIGKLKTDVEKDPTPENRMKYANTIAIANKIKQYEAEGKPFSFVKENIYEPMADSVSTTAQNFKKVSLEAQNERARLARDAAIQRAELMAVLKAQEIAARQQNKEVGKQTRINTETMKLDQAYSKMEQRITSELDKIISEQGEEVVNPNASIWTSGDSTIPNPRVAEKKQQLQDLRDRHDSNMTGLQEAIEAGKTFVPKPYSNLTPKATQEPKSSDYSSEQEGWIDKAMKANPGLSREAVIDQGKKLKKL